MQGTGTGGHKLQTALLSLEEKVMGETPQSLMAARLSRNMLRRKEKLLFASDLFPSIVGKAKGQERFFFLIFVFLQGRSVSGNVVVLLCSYVALGRFFLFIEFLNSDSSTNIK